MRQLSPPSGSKNNTQSGRGVPSPFISWSSPALKNPLALLILITVLSLAFTPAPSAEKKGVPVRKAAVAGGFYPADPETLETLVDTLLRQAHPPQLEGSIRAILVPHAGYIYSGPVAAFAYKAIEGRDIRTVILLGNSHTDGFDGIAVYKEGFFETPLGQVEIDSALARKILAADPKIVDRPSVHERDHILEVQLPFLQRALHHFKIVPIVFGSDDPKLTELLAKTLKDLIDDKTLLLASTDMSHSPPYAAAIAADQQTIAALLKSEPAGLDQTLQQLSGERVPNAQTFLCGPSGVRTVMLLAKDLGFENTTLLQYANSGDSPAGDKRQVVGYSAIVFTQTQKDMGKTSASEAALLNRSEQEALLKIARTTVKGYLRTGKIPAFSPRTQILRKPFGAFVTLKERGQLRGCIGRFEPSEPLYLTVQHMAIAAATQDPRFRPVAAQELEKLEYEISVLSPLRHVKSAEEILLGKHGVTISNGSHHGVFLPQVATETGWGKEKFLSELCSQKAGLPENCWKDPQTNLQVFTAEIFSEEKK